MKKKVVLLTNELTRANGWATLGFELFLCLKPVYDVTVLTYQGAPNLLSSDKIFPIIPPESNWTLYEFLYLFKNVPKLEADVVICNVERFLPLAVLLKLRLRSMLLLIGHGTYIYRPFVLSYKRFIRRPFLSFIDGLVVPSRYTLQKVQEFYAGKVEVVPWGVNLQRYFPIASIQKERAFIFVGALKKRKGIQYLLQAFEKLIQEFPECRLYIVGKTKADKSVTLNQNVLDHLVITGEVSHDELLRYYSKSIAHVLPSVSTPLTFEGFGLVHLEANACGLPSIGSRDCGNEDAIVDGMTGFLCPQRDAEALYQKMKLLLIDEILRKDMGQRALAYVQEHTWQKVGKQFIRIIDEL